MDSTDEKDGFTRGDCISLGNQRKPPVEQDRFPSIVEAESTHDDRHRMFLM